MVDAGLGEMSGDTFKGGKLLDELSGAGCAPEEVNDIAVSHLHIDHCGWLLDSNSSPQFPRARIWVGAADWEHFVERATGVMLDSVREGLKRLASDGRITVVDGDRLIAPGLDALAAPGHTPGHLTFVVSDGPERALLLGDSVTCPVQLDEADWGAMSDVDPTLARRTRERLWDEMEQSGVPGVGAHFPGLRFGRVLAGSGRRYWD
jgi:glyoxylase-like metal-dependent hydrolase (beta-lactamase superfamily II)